MNESSNNLRDWDKIKQNLYTRDGSLRDIYVLNATKEDWLKWIDFVNENYNLTWVAENFNDNLPSKTISSQFISKRWEEREGITSASIFLNNIQVNCFFFTSTEIENDIEPREIDSLNEHYKVVEYMKAISKLLDKEVVLTEENCEQAVLLLVSGNKVQMIEPNRF